MMSRRKRHSCSGGWVPKSKPCGPAELWIRAMYVTY